MPGMFPCSLFLMISPRGFWRSAGKSLSSLIWVWLPPPGFALELGAGSIPALLPKTREEEEEERDTGWLWKAPRWDLPLPGSFPKVLQLLRQAGMKESSRLWSSCDPAAPVTLPGGSDRALCDI